MAAKIEIDMAKMFGGDLDRYYNWNIGNAARVIVRKPEEYEITLMVYRLHKTILANSGFDSRKLEEGDDKLIELIKKIGGAPLN